MKEQDQILKTLANPKPMKTQKDQLDYANAKNCHICEKSLILPEFHAGKDLYDPNTGQHIGQVHQKMFIRGSSGIYWSGSKTKR